MRGPDILVRTISQPLPKGPKHTPWQYNSRSDHHSKVACWGIVFDLLLNCGLLRKHVAQGKVGFGINHRLYNFKADRKKDLDLVLCRPGQGRAFAKYGDLVEMAGALSILLDDQERRDLTGLPRLPVVPVGSVLVALEAKACMTEHVKALPRLHDELNSSHQIAHGAADEAIVGGYALVNVAKRFVSPGKNPKPFTASPRWNEHRQPEAVDAVIRTLRDLPRRTKTGEVGFDAMAVVVVDCVNDDVTPVGLHSAAPAPQPNDNFHYASMINRICQLYGSRFRVI